MMNKVEKNHHEKSIKKSKIVRLLQTFSRKELQEVDHFLKSFFSTRYLALQVYTYLERIAPGFEEERALDIAAIYLAVYDHVPAVPKDIVNLQNTISDLYTYLMRFLVWKETDQSNYEVELLKLKVLKKRGLRVDYLSHIQLVSKRLEKKKDKDFWYPIQQLQLKDKFYYSTDIESIDKNSNVVLEAMGYLDEFFFTAKLKYACELIGRMKVRQEKHEILLLEEVVQCFDKKGNKSNNLAELYNNTLILLQKGEQKDYYTLKRQIEDNALLDRSELFVLWVYLLNFSTRLVGDGDSSALRLSFELYKFGLKKEIFTASGYFPAVLFLNFVNTGVLLGVYGELTQFIDKWGNTLKPEIREDTLNLIRAIIQFGKGDYEATIELCKDLKPKQAHYKIQCKLLELKSFYEERDNYQKKIYRKCDQFEKFLKEHKTLGKLYTDGGLNFLMIFKLLLSAKNKKEIENKLIALHPLVAKDWLVSKMKLL